LIPAPMISTETLGFSLSEERISFRFIVFYVER
jgi:hypothetical protein